MISEEQRKRMEENRAAALARRQKTIPDSFPSMEKQSKQPFRNSTNSALQNSTNTTNAQRDDCTGFPQGTYSFCSLTGPVPQKSFAHEPEKKYPSGRNPHRNQDLCAMFPTKKITRVDSKMANTAAPIDAVKLDNPPLKHIEVSLELVALDQFTAHISDPSPSAMGAFDSLLSSICPLRGDRTERTAVYHLRDYTTVVNFLKDTLGFALNQVPNYTLHIVQKMLQLNYSPQDWVPFMPVHTKDNDVDTLIQNIPSKLRKALMPFQLEGVRYGLRRGGRCLIADEMGVGKTIQAIALAACYVKEGSILITCPASLRLMWAEELERWLPFLLPVDIHLVFGRKNNIPDNVPTPKVVVISYTMLRRLKKSMMSRKWGMLIVDESHNVRCTKNKVECEETTAILDIGQKIRRIVLLSGTPSLSRPFDIFHQVNMLSPCLLGRNKYEFAQNYCFSEQSKGFQTPWNKDFSKGCRLHELNILLKETIMIRRLKNDVLAQLPPKRRQVIRLTLETTDILHAKSEVGKVTTTKKSTPCTCGLSFKGCCDCEDEDENEEDESGNDHENDQARPKKGLEPLTLSYQEIGLSKLKGVCEWLSNHPVISSSNDNLACSSEQVQKMIIFAHHIKVLDSLQEMVHSKGLEYVRIDGSTITSDRQKAVESFRSKDEVKIAIIGLTAGGVGLNFCSAQTVVFAELPKTTSELLQAEDRAHRYGQKSAVNIYYFCAKDTSDEVQWQTLNRSTERVSTMTNGSENAVNEIEITAVLNGSSVIGDNTEKLCPGQIDDNMLENARRTSVGVGHVSIENSSENQSQNSMLNIYDSAGVNSAHEPEVSHTAICPDNLMFEVSANTGRIHLYTRSNFDGYRPITLQENFLPEDLGPSKRISDLPQSSNLPVCIKDYPENFKHAVSFIKQWNELRPIDRNCLLGRPLQLPLAQELECSKFELSYGKGGVVKGGSKRRVTPITEINTNIPEDAVWKNVTLQRQSYKERQIQQAWSASDEPLCKLCFCPCLSANAKKPDFFEDLFCNKDCYQEFRMKTSQSYIRQELFALEKGVCAMCKLDCHALVEKIRPLSKENRKAYIVKKAPEFSKHIRLLERLVTEPKEGNAWHADHIVAVFQGGGECNLRNLRTLCVVCHAKVTAEQCKKRRKSFSRAKDGFQHTIEKFIEKFCDKRMQTCNSDGVSVRPKIETVLSDDDDSDSDIFNIEIKGSVYSKAASNKLEN